MLDPLLMVSVAALAVLLERSVRMVLAHVQIERTTRYWIRTITEATAVAAEVPVAVPTSADARHASLAIRGRGVGPARR